ncbi:hypothetical protein HDK90DRAFT_544459, partial [Phyllosticta capitalensis]
QEPWRITQPTTFAVSDPGLPVLAVSFRAASGVYSTTMFSTPWVPRPIPQPTLMLGVLFLLTLLRRRPKLRRRRASRQRSRRLPRSALASQRNATVRARRRSVQLLRKLPTARPLSHLRRKSVVGLLLAPPSVSKALAPPSLVLLSEAPPASARRTSRRPSAPSSRTLMTLLLSTATFLTSRMRSLQSSTWKSSKLGTVKCRGPVV